MEFDDSAGNKYEFTFTGRATRQKAKYLLELIELLGNTQEEAAPSPTDGSKLGLLCSLLTTKFLRKWFTSNEVQVLYEENRGECLPLSTVCTYLARLTDRGVLMRRGPANSLEYRVSSSVIFQEIGSSTSDAPVTRS